MLNLSFDYYYINESAAHTLPAWMKSERYHFCENNFCQLFNFFRRFK